jgi:hypothetical protein
MVDVEHKVDERVRVVHPAQTQHEGSMERAQVEGQRLHDERDEDGECGDEDCRRLLLDRVQLVFVYFLVVDESVERRKEAEDVLEVYRKTDADAGDVRISGDQAHGGGERGRMAERVQGPVSFWYMKSEDSGWLQRVVCQRRQPYNVRR